MARPTKLNDAVQTAIVNALRAGNYLETAVKYAGIDKKTAYNWIARGQKGEPRYQAFLHAIEKAQADSEARDVAIIAKASETQWQASAWRLERKFPDRWGRRDHMIVGGDQVRPLKVVLTRDDERPA